MKSKLVGLLILAITMVMSENFYARADAQEPVRIVLSEAGTLWDVLEEQDIRLWEVESLSIEGPIDKDDILSIYVCSALNADMYPSSKLKEVNLGNAFIEEGYFPDYAFSGAVDDYGESLQCSIRQLTLPTNTETIGEQAFGEMTLESIILPSSLRRIGYMAFWKVSFENQDVVLPEGLIEIGSGCFAEARNIKSISLPSTLEKIGDDAFIYCCDLDELSIPGSITSIGTYAFHNMPNLERVELREGITTVPYCAFALNASLKSVKLPSTITTLDGYAFSHCSGLKEIELPEGLEKFDEFVFAEDGLRTITLPSSLKDMGRYAFANCPLESIVCRFSTPAQNDGITLDLNVAVYIPQGSLDAFKAAPGWKDFTTFIEYDPASVGEISITIPTEIKVMGGKLIIGSDQVVEYSVYRPDGTIVAQGYSNSFSLDLPNGIYVVRAGPKTTKISI